MGVESDWYKVVVFLHIFTAIVGFGTVFLNGIYGKQAEARKGPDGLAISEATYLVSKTARYFIYAVLLTGLLLVWMSDGVWSFGDTFIWIAVVLFLVAIALSHAVLSPAILKMQELSRQLIVAGPPPPGAASGAPPPQAQELQSLGKRVGLTSTVLDLMMVVILVLMVWKPL